MARVTVEDCIDKVDSPYELVLVAKERATQLRELFEQDLTAPVGARINEKVIPPAEINKAVTSTCLLMFQQN